ACGGRLTISQVSPGGNLPWATSVDRSHQGLDPSLSGDGSLVRHLLEPEERAVPEKCLRAHRRGAGRDRNALVIRLPRRGPPGDAPRPSRLRVHAQVEVTTGREV